MGDSLIRKMLDNWERRSLVADERVKTDVVLNRQDLIRLEALAEAYDLPADELLADLIGTALREVEQQIPYEAGSRVIRVEEGDPVYEDVGRTPSYLAAIARRERESEGNGD